MFNKHNTESNMRKTFIRNNRIHKKSYALSDHDSSQLNIKNSKSYSIMSDIKPKKQ